MSKIIVGSKVIIGTVSSRWPHYCEPLDEQAGTAGNVTGIRTTSMGRTLIAVRTASGSQWNYPPESLELFDGIKEGDTVVCVDAKDSGSPSGLIAGSTHTVKVIVGGVAPKLQIRESGFGWYTSRFEFVSRPQSVPARKFIVSAVPREFDSEQDARDWILGRADVGAAGIFYKIGSVTETVRVVPAVPAVPARIEVVL
jgi:hypothetical protein